MGKAHPAAAGFVAAEGQADPILEAGEQALDMVAPGVQRGVLVRRIDHAALGQV
jgi:hypothetical protein